MKHVDDGDETIDAFVVRGRREAVFVEHYSKKLVDRLLGLIGPNCNVLATASTRRQKDHEDLRGIVFAERVFVGMEEVDAVVKETAREEPVEDEVLL